MKTRIQNQFIINYVLMFVLSTIIGFFALMLVDFSSHVLSDTLVKNRYTADSLMRDDVDAIDAAPVVDHGGGIQVIDSQYNVVYSKGLDLFSRQALTAQEFTDFLMNSRSPGVPYSSSVAYNEARRFWLVVTFPTSLRIDFAIARNTDYASADVDDVIGAVAAIVIFYLLMLGLSTVIYSKLTSISIVSPLRKLCAGARRLRDGDYSARVDLPLKNEFGELRDTFNAMAGQIEREIELRKQSEQNRRQLVLDISHDLKNPLAAIMGYAELCAGHPELSPRERTGYLRIIEQSSRRAAALINHLFELSKLESPGYVLVKVPVDAAEYMREKMSAALPLLEKAGFACQCDIPEGEMPSMMDTRHMDRVFENLVDNAVRYNPPGTCITVDVSQAGDDIIILFADDGIGMDPEVARHVFEPFVRAGDARSSRTGGTGLGLAIVRAVLKAHGGSVCLDSRPGEGCVFTLRIPKN